VATDTLERFGLDLAYALACDAELFAYFFERVVNAILEPVTQFEDLALFRRKFVKDLPKLIC
jgi:hypothetical protein